MQYKLAVTPLFLADFELISLVRKIKYIINESVSSFFSILTCKSVKTNINILSYSFQQTTFSCRHLKHYYLKNSSLWKQKKSCEDVTNQVVLSNSHLKCQQFLFETLVLL